MINISSMIRVEPLKERERICQLVNSVWATHYQNASLLPKWNPDFFDWQFLCVPDGWAAVCLGIYLNDELVGIFCGDCWPLLMDGAQTHATFLSCICVSTAARHPAVAEAGLNGLREWSEHHDSHYFIGFVNPASSHAAGRRYWTTRRGYSHAFSSFSRQWQINPMRTLYAEEGVDSKLSGNVDRAVALLGAQMGVLARRDIATLFCPDGRLRHQLDFDPITRCVIVEECGEIGVCSFYVLPTHVNSHIGYFDFISSSTPDGLLADKAFALAIAKMKALCCERAFVLGCPNHSDRLLSRLGFRPCIPSYTPLIVSWDKSRSLPKHGAFCSQIFR